MPDNNTNENNNNNNDPDVTTTITNSSTTTINTTTSSSTTIIDANGNSTTTSSSSSSSSTTSSTGNQPNTQTNTPTTQTNGQTNQNNGQTNNQTNNQNKTQTPTKKKKLTEAEVAERKWAEIQKQLILRGQKPWWYAGSEALAEGTSVNKAEKYYEKGYIERDENKNIIKREFKKPFFYINGHPFHVSVSAEAKSEINLVKNKMFVPAQYFGYTDIQWTNFTGETITCDIYTRVGEKYIGTNAQPLYGAQKNFYKTARQAHAVLKYWAQNFVKCHIYTNLHAFETGDYVIDEFKQTEPSYDFMVTSLTFIQYEKPEEIKQTYRIFDAPSKDEKDTSKLAAHYWEIISVPIVLKKKCECKKDTPAKECTAEADDNVKIIQKWLKKWGYFPRTSSTTGNIKVNGKFCYWTEYALKLFQKDYGLTVNGEFNQETRREMAQKSRYT